MYEFILVVSPYQKIRGTSRKHESEQFFLLKNNDKYILTNDKREIKMQT